MTQGRKKPARVWLSASQVARRCGVSPRTVAKWIDRGLLRGYKLPGSAHRRVFPRDLKTFMFAHGMLRPAEPGESKTQLTLDFSDDLPTEAPRRSRPAAIGEGYAEVLRRNAWPYDRIEGFPLTRH